MISDTAIFSSSVISAAASATPYSFGMVVTNLQVVRSKMNGQKYARITTSPVQLIANTDPALDTYNFVIDNASYPIGSVALFNERGDTATTLAFNGQLWLRSGEIITDNVMTLAAGYEDALLSFGQYTIGYTPAQTGLPTNQICVGLGAASNGVCMALYDNGAAYRSMDYGITWTQIVTSGTYGMFANNDTGTWWFTGPTGVASVTTNNGASWNLIPRPFATDVTPILFKFTDGSLYWGKGTLTDCVATGTAADVIALYKRGNVTDTTTGWETITHPGNVMTAAGVPAGSNSYWTDVTVDGAFTFLLGFAIVNSNANKIPMSLVINRTNASSPTYSAKYYSDMLFENVGTKIQTFVYDGKRAWINGSWYNSSNSTYYQMCVGIDKAFNYTTIKNISTTVNPNLFHYTQGYSMAGAYYLNWHYKYGATILPDGSNSKSRTYSTNPVVTSPLVKQGSIVAGNLVHRSAMAGNCCVQVCVGGYVVRMLPHIGMPTALKPNPDSTYYLRIG